MSAIVVPSNQPNVLFLFSDQHNHRYFSRREERGEPVRTPAMDRMANDGVAFEQTYCPMPLCTPSRLCTLTGKNVQNASAWNNGGMLFPEHTTLPEAFREAGYATSLVGKMHLGGDRQFVGFEDRPYGDLLGLNGHQYEPVSPERREHGTVGVTEYPESQLQERIVAEESLSWLREHRHENSDQPWFLCASISRPHAPLTAPPRHVDRYWPDATPPPPVTRDDVDTADNGLTRSRAIEDEDDMMRDRAHYMACVDFLDEMIDDFLSSLGNAGFLEDTIVVYASDHGDTMGEHGTSGKATWHEGATRVPMLFELPEHRNGESTGADVDTPVNLIDLYPTLCGLCGIDPPADLDGTDLSETVRTGIEPARGPVFCDYWARNAPEGHEFRAVRDGRYKYVRFRDAEDLLFDIEADPFETHNLAPDATGEERDAYERMREIAYESMDFEEAQRQRERDVEAQRGRGFSVPRGIAGNAYCLFDGRVVDAGITVTKPDVLVENPSAAFADWPEDDGV